VYTFGYGFFGQLGNGRDNNCDTPQHIAVGPDGPITAKAIAAGAYHTVLLSSEGRVYTFGSGGYGRLGNGQNNNCNTPQRIVHGPDGPITAKAIAAGGEHTVVLGVDGQVYTFGYGEKGQLGNGRNNTCNTPQRIVHGPDGRPITAKAIAAGGMYTVILAVDGQVYTFGNNALGELGNGRDDNCNTPQSIAAGPDGRPITAKAIAAGHFYTVVLGVDGRVYTFGWGKEGQLGNGRNDNCNTPQHIAAGPDGRPITAKAIAAGGMYTVILAVDGQVYTFGNNALGELGNGQNNTCNTPQRIEIRGLDGRPIIACAITAGDYHTAVLGMDGHVYTFGKGEYSQLGDGRSGTVYIR
jgi:alpha-tubulin suppressor-like RCC1 family protein